MGVAENFLVGKLIVAGFSICVLQKLLKYN